MSCPNLKDLDPVISPVSNNNISLGSHSDTLRPFKLSSVVSFCSKPSDERPVFVKDLNPMIIRVAHNDAVVSVGSNTSWPVELSVGSSAPSEVE